MFYLIFNPVTGRYVTEEGETDNIYEAKRFISKAFLDSFALSISDRLELYEHRCIYTTDIRTLYDD